MDKTETYRNMVDCPEIQDKWGNGTTLELLPSYVYDREIERVCIVLWTPKTLQDKLQNEAPANTVQVSIEWDKELGHWTPANELYRATIWLPRQDQLQEMVEAKDAFDLALIFAGRLTSIHMEEYYWDLGSMEQLWLAFVMKKRHGKVWKGEKWDSIV